VQSALTSGYQLAFVVAAGCVLVGIVLAPILLRGTTGASDEPEAMSDEERREFEAHVV
jgi:hypothetical protein